LRPAVVPSLLPRGRETAMALGGRGARPAAVRLGDDELIKIGARRYDWRNPYAFALTVKWPTFFLAVAGIDLAINLTFALLFLAGENSIVNAHPGSLMDAFFFSVETFSTVGYGVMSPNTTYAHVVATTDILCGVTFTALFTGLIFVRFSKPQARMVYAEHPVVAIHEGKPTLMIRFASATTSMMTGASVRLNVLLLRTTVEGRTYRQAFELPLIRSYIPLLLLSWTLMHEINEDSPLYGMALDELVEADARLLLTVEVRDHSLGALVVDVKTYGPADVLFGVAYQDIIEYRRGRTQVDLRRISNVEPDNGLAEDHIGASVTVA
jgi:inward rectifier potassium channel